MSDAPFPTVESYLARLPLGLDSHPECQAKSSVLCDALSSRSLSDVLHLLPDPVRELVANPPPVNAWVGEVHALVALLAIRDRHFAPGAVGLTDYETWAHRRNRDLLTRPLYRALFVLLTPERLLNGMQRRWNQFRRGTSVELLERGTDRVVLRVRFPTDLYELTALHGLRGALRAALEAAGARGARIELVDAGPRDARYAVQWR